MNGSNDQQGGGGMSGEQQQQQQQRPGAAASRQQQGGGQQQQQPQQQQIAPVAPYPPILASSSQQQHRFYPSTQVSSLRSSLKNPQQQQQQQGQQNHPLASSIAGVGVGVGGGGGGSGTNLSGAVSVATSAGGGGGGSGFLEENNNTKSSRRQQLLKQAAAFARVRFCQWDALACINCADVAPPEPQAITSSSSNNNSVVQPLWSSSEQTTAAQEAAAGNLNGNAATPVRTNRTTAASSSSRKKQGPLLLELRRLELPRSCNHEKYTENDSSSLLQTVTLCQSRGNPSLGTSITSTCLDVEPGLSPDHAAAAAAGGRFPRCATGLSTGALCVHSFHSHNEQDEEQPNIILGGGSMSDLDEYDNDNDNDSNQLAASIEYYYVPRSHRAATAVAWRPSNPNHVAVGLTGVGTERHHHHHHHGGSSSAAAGGAGGAGVVVASRSAGSVPGVVGGAAGSGTGSSRGAGDRDYCCFVWDVEHQQQPQAPATTATAAASGSSNGTALRHRTKNAPLYKLSHLSGVASLGWILADGSGSGGSTLVVGGQQRHLQLCDLRANNAAAAPVTLYAHNFGVHGIAVDPVRPWQFATFSRAAGEPVKLWDARRLDAPVSELKVPAASLVHNSSSGGASGHAGNRKAASSDSLSSLSRSVASSAAVASVQWSMIDSGHLSVLVGDSSLHVYDTSTSGTRPVHVTSLHHHRQPILDFCHYPYANLDHVGGGTSVYNNKTEPNSAAPSLAAEHRTRKKKILQELFPKRLVVVQASDQTVRDVPAHRVAPLAVSHRTGQVLHSLGRTLFADNFKSEVDSDISTTMMRRARCLHVAKYSMDTVANIELLSRELQQQQKATVSNSTASASALSSSTATGSRTTLEQLVRLWKWIQRAELLCDDTPSMEDYMVVAQHEQQSDFLWPAKGLVDAGALRLLEMDEGKGETNSRSESLCCATYDSEGRRAALTSCGWAGRYELDSVMEECEASGEYERSAALAVWHGDIGAAVDALQRGSSFIQRQLSKKSKKKRYKHHYTSKYTETLDLVSLSIAGYRGGDARSGASHVWRKACAKLLQRPELSDSSGSSGVGYLRQILKFLMTIGIDDSHKDVLSDKTLSLCDRVAFACRFLTRADLKQYLDTCVDDCEITGNVEGMTITGIEKKGILILQSYMDRSADVQSAALITSRVIFPSDWIAERKAIAEWLHAYRSLLNRWQMWQSRAMFDVDRSELLRKVKMRQTEGNMVSSKHSGVRRIPPGRRPGVRSPDPDVQASVPAQLDARCNYCSSPLGLRKQDSHPNQWLSKMKNVLSCCPQCRKPLPRCAICMLSLGALNPYTELTKRGSSPAQTPDNLASLANLPFAEWFTWCMRCKHGGHAHHLVGWFSKHEVCPVSGCDCQCQFDGIDKLRRPSISTHSSSNELKEQVSDLHEEETERH